MSSEKCSSDDGIAFDEKVEPSLIEVQGVAAGTWDLKDPHDIDPSSSRRVKCRRLVKAHVTLALRRFVLRPEPISPGRHRFHSSRTAGSPARPMLGGTLDAKSAERYAMLARELIWRDMSSMAARAI